MKSFIPYLLIKSNTLQKAKLSAKVGRKAMGLMQIAKPTQKSLFYLSIANISVWHECYFWCCDLIIYRVFM